MNPKIRIKRKLFPDKVLKEEKDFNVTQEGDVVVIQVKPNIIPKDSPKIEIDLKGCEKGRLYVLDIGDDPVKIGIPEEEDEEYEDNENY